MAKEIAKPCVAVVTTVHRAFDTRIFHKQAVSLAAAGYEVVLVQRGDAPEVVKGVRVVPLPTAPNRYVRVTWNCWLALRAVLNSGATICHLHDPELIPVGLVLKMLGKTVVYDVHEELVLVNDRAYVPAWAKRPLAWVIGGVESLAERFFDRIVAATSLIAEHFSADRVTLVRNTPRLEELADCGRSRFAERPRQAFCAGGMAHYNGVDLMVAAVAALPDRPPSRLVLGGEFLNERDRDDMLSRPGADRVGFLGWLDRPALAREMGQSRVGIALYRRTANVLRADPIKLYEMMGAGLPVVVSDVPRWRDLVLQNDCGIMVDPEDAQACAAALSRILDNPEEAEAMGRRARATILAGYEWSVDESRLLDLYQDLSQRRGRELRNTAS
jgi:glycosyltransferase involved in cell wall biosynthesis